MPKNTKDSAKARKVELKKCYRQKERVQKHFHYPLIPFLETKYPKVYEEYIKLYNWLNEEHPQTRNLTKTLSFKTWKESIQSRQTVSDNPPTTSDNDDVTETTSENTGTTSDISDVTETTTTSENTATTVNVSVSENTPPVNVSIEELADIMVNIEGQADQIINELREDADLRRIMDNVENQVIDEGIDISPLDDIEFDIEPFDFQAEVENYDW